jgi:hypothetical protein
MEEPRSEKDGLRVSEVKANWLGAISHERQCEEGVAGV